jgi:hypothetical protein
MIKVQNPGLGGGTLFTLKCPECGQGGTFQRIVDVQDLHVTGHWLGHRECPNPACKAHVFFVANDGFTVQRTYPPIQIAFDATNIPDRIRKALLEAVTCDADGCYMAAAIMVRRTLEELCEDRKATGANLKERIKTLQGSVVLPAELFAAMDELRLLGNDAAHIEAKVYDQISHAEIEAAIELTKEILKAVFQLDSLVNKLKSLRKTSP